MSAIIFYHSTFLFPNAKMLCCALTKTIPKLDMFHCFSCFTFANNSDIWRISTYIVPKTKPSLNITGHSVVGSNQRVIYSLRNS